MAEAQPNSLTLAQELASIASRAQTYTGASGAAIALSEGDVTQMVCRASSGGSAPDVGAHIHLEGTFTGMAVQSGQALRCDDSDTDNRVDAAACRALGTRSIVVVPIRDLDTELVCGVLAVFAGSKGAFNDLHVAVLRTMAREVAAAVQKARKSGGLGALSAEASASPAITGSPTPAAPAPPIAPPRPSAAPVAPSAAAAAPKLAAEPAATLMSPAPKAVPPASPRQGEAHVPLPVAAPIVPAKKTFTAPATPEWKPAPPPPPRRAEALERAVEKKESRPIATTFGTFDSVAGDKKPGGGGIGIWIGVGVAAAVIVGGYFAYNAFSGKPASPPQAQSQPAPAAAPEAQPAATPAGEPAAAASQPAASAPQTSAKPAPAPATPPQSAAAKPAEPQAPAPVAQPPAPKPQPQPVERAAVTPSATPRAEEPPKPIAAVPQIQVPIVTAAPALAPKVSQSVPAQLVTQVAPRYPEMARTMRAGGNVVVDAIVNKDGTVGAVKVISGHTLLRDAATSAVKQWRYKPAMLNGSAVESTVRITVKFPELR